MLETQKKLKNLRQNVCKQLKLFTSHRSSHFSQQVKSRKNTDKACRPCHVLTKCFLASARLERDDCAWPLVIKKHKNLSFNLQRARQIVVQMTMLQGIMTSTMTVMNDSTLITRRTPHGVPSKNIKHMSNNLRFSSIDSNFPSLRLLSS
jgi:hypothetical protein